MTSISKCLNAAWLFCLVSIGGGDAGGVGRFRGVISEAILGGFLLVLFYELPNSFFVLFCV